MTHDNKRFVARDRNWHPPAYAPGYKTSVARSPQQALVSMQQPTASELTGPDFSHLRMGPHDNGKPIPHTLVEMWQANAGGRYRHKNDKYLAPLDPNFGGVGRCLTDEQGMYRFRTIKPGPYPWPNDMNSWRPAHIHVSVTGPSISTRLITQMYFEGDPLIPLCPIVHTLKDPLAVETMIGRLDMAHSRPMDCLAYRFDVVVRGELQTFFENQ